MNAPQIPMMMSPIKPYPSPITSDASTPATKPTMIHVRRAIGMLRNENAEGTGNSRARPSRYGTGAVGGRSSNSLGGSAPIRFFTK
jgi:hypothetical protein